MSKKVMLTIQGTQIIEDEAPQRLEMTSEATMSCENGTYTFTYEETELTGIQGTTTTFTVAEDKIVLARDGSIKSKMTFIPNEEDISFYELEFGALVLGICTRYIGSNLTENGGWFRFVYDLRVDDYPAGRMTYEIKVKCI